MLDINSGAVVQGLEDFLDVSKSFNDKQLCVWQVTVIG